MLKFTNTIRRRYLSLPGLILVLLLSCADEPATQLTKRQEVEALLTGKRWNLVSVTVEGEQRNELFVDFSITFSVGTYTTTGTTPVWSRTGTWSFTSDDASGLVREDGVEVAIGALDDATLELKLVFDREVHGSGRSNALKGEHYFKFSH